MTYVKPFLKWAGGKHKLLDKILPNLPSGKRLIEPFVGGGSIFAAADYPAFLLADINPELINLYLSLQDRGAEFIGLCRTFFTPENNTPQRYYQLRDQFRAVAPTPTMQAALFLYLNRHGFNGLCRYSKKSGFNVPYGRYKNPYFPLREMAHFYTKSWQRDALFACAPFYDVMNMAGKGDVVYCDPPYLPLDQKTNFTKYSHGNFTLDNHKRLARLAETLTYRGTTVAISNHDTPQARALYQNATRVIGYDVQRTIAANPERRGLVGELLVIYEAKRVIENE
jgi:DNA adenine methylase